MKHLLEADGIQLSFGLRLILNAIYVKVQTGEITGMLARNGQGKTCLMNVIYGSLKAQSRSIRIDDKSVFEAYKQPKQINYLPQFNFIPNSFTLKRIFNDFDTDLNIFFDHFEITEMTCKTKIKELSGGMRRLIEVYLMVKSKSKFTMLDEPFSHIMPVHIEKIKLLLQTEKQHKGFLITDHLYSNILEISDRLYLLKNGATHAINDLTELVFLGYLSSASFSQ